MVTCGRRSRSYSAEYSVQGFSTGKTWDGGGVEREGRMTGQGIFFFIYFISERETPISTCRMGRMGRGYLVNFSLSTYRLKIPPLKGKRIESCLQLSMEGKQC